MLYLCLVLINEILYMQGVLSQNKFELLYKLLHKMVKLHTNIQKNIYINGININNTPNSAYLKIKFSFHYKGYINSEHLQWRLKVLVMWLLFLFVVVGFLCIFFFLLIDLDDTEKNEKLKFSIVMRLPEVTNDFRCNFLDSGVDRKFLRVHRIKPMEDLGVIQIGHRCNLNLHSFSICCLWPVGYPDNLDYRLVHSVLQCLQYRTGIRQDWHCSAECLSA